MSDRRATIRDVAQRAGVSLTSVSNYSNGRLARLSAETQARIASAMQELDYQPNRLAQQLKTGVMPVFGLLMPSVVNPFFGALSLEVEHAGLRRGYRMLTCNTQRDEAREAAFVKDLAGFGVKHFVTLSPNFELWDGDGHGRKDITFVAIDASREIIRNPNVDLVNVDNRTAIRLAVEHLLALGHRKIAYVTDQGATTAREERLSAFRQIAEKADIDQSGIVVINTTPGHRSAPDTDMTALGREAVEKVLALPELPTAIIAVNDMLALGLLASLREHGLSVPGNLSVIGVDDLFVSRLISPTLTSVRQPLKAMADAAMERVVSRAAVPDQPARDIVYQPDLIMRETTSSPGRSP